MKRKDGWRTVYEGAELVLACEGGFIRKAATESGIAYDHPAGDIFLPWSRVAELQAELTRGKKRAEKEAKDGE